jgi:hypothetical protein
MVQKFSKVLWNYRTSARYWMHHFTKHHKPTNIYTPNAKLQQVKQLTRNSVFVEETAFNVQSHAKLATKPQKYKVMTK